MTFIRHGEKRSFCGMYRTARRTTALATGLILTASLTTVSATAATSADRTGDVAASEVGLDRFHHQHLDWRSCVLGPDDAVGRNLEQAGARCANVTVPLDYGNPRGRTTTVAISRLAATDTRRRLGALLLNYGGPGNDTIGAPPDTRTAMKDVGARYDIIGMDPRFVGRSNQLDCGWPVGTNIFAAGLTRAAFDRQIALQKDLADRCRATNASVLPYVTTRNTARDMDVIRAALGERKISYLGYSYGTYLGTAYTQMFPGRYDRVVLDGALDPNNYGSRTLRGGEAEYEHAFGDWAAWAASRNDVYGLGRTRDEVLATADRIVAASARSPLTVGTAPEVFRVDDTQVPFVYFIGIADDSDAARAALAEQVSVLNKAARGLPAPASPGLVGLLRFALTGGGSPHGSAQSAVFCGDVAAPRNPEVYWLDVQRSRAAHPLFGPLSNNIVPCAFWDRPREQPTRVQRDSAIMIVAATGDPRTVYKGSVALHNQLPGSRLVTLQGANQHGVFGSYGNACVDNQVNAYLATGTLPATDPTCVK
ncbi:alpha/beta hydrolase (plasmid) [Embleya sp. NBC_00888]|uniref:alpha/beta hydrolase n=1 Tax=Embleya sp. NBC_00888 TaxID=2975960 RepID=UPI002F9118EC|nr:alpha/beta hydrolase [Embleya sp. NBC_00888]